MSLKKICLLPLVVVLGAGLFAAETEKLFDENLPTQTTNISTSISFKPKMGVIWGYDALTEQSGFKEVIDLDLEWEILPYRDWATDTSDQEYGLPYGMVMYSGGHMMFKIQNQSGDLGATDKPKDHDIVPYLSINYEKLWGKIVWDPFYLLLAASEKNFYTRMTGWTFPTSNDKVRANWAHIGSRVQNWVSAFNQDTWNLAGYYNQGGAETLGGAGMGLGYITGSTEVLAMVASPSDWTANSKNVYDYGISLESNPIGDLMVRASGLSGVNYKNQPLAFSGSAGYRFDITNTIAIMPHTAMDFVFKPVLNDPFASYKTENSFGFDVSWPGANGWADNPLMDQESNMYAGLTVDGSVVTTKFEDPSYAMAISMHEDTDGGLVPNLGVTLVYELGQIEKIGTDEKDFVVNCYGVYVDYSIWNQFRPYTRLKKIGGAYGDPLQAEIGFEVTVIPHTSITFKYNTNDIKDTRAATKLTDDTDQRLFTAEFIVTF